MYEDKDENAPKPDLNPMIDVVFQLLVFFLVTMKFKTLDMKIEAFLPKDKGLAQTIQEPDEKPKVVAVLKRKPGEPVTRVKVANLTLGDTSTPEVWGRLTIKAKETLDRHLANNGKAEDVSGEVDASAFVPTGMVIRAVDAFVAAGIANVTFVGTPPPNSAINRKMKEAMGVK
jgi:biopolymer transport protein ExbD